MIFRCPHCKGTKIDGTALVRIDFTPDDDGFDFDYMEIEDQIAGLIDTNGAITFRCADCNKYFGAKEVLKEV